MTTTTPMPPQTPAVHGYISEKDNLTHCVTAAIHDKIKEASDAIALLVKA